MENELNQRWRQGLPPFDGETVYTPDFVTLANLTAPLSAVIEQLYVLTGDIPIIKFDDWHEHDGFVKDGIQTSWEELPSLTTSEHALLAASTGESYVRLAFCPVDRSWLLRLDVPNRDDNPYFDHDDPKLIHYGRFDITCDTELALKLYTVAHAAGSLSILKTPAKAFFDRRYNG